MILRKGENYKMNIHRSFAHIDLALVSQKPIDWLLPADRF